MIPSTERQAIIAAMEHFDQELRDSASWLDWEKRKNNLYAIRWHDQLYPVKKIISIATSTPTDVFGGGKESNTYISARGFETVKLRQEPTNSDSETKGADILYSNPRVWWVNQGGSYARKFVNHSIFTPLTKSDGQRRPSIKLMRQVKVGDIIVHYASGTVRAVSRVTLEPYDSLTPFDHTWSLPDVSGVRIEIDYHPLKNPVSIKPFQKALAELKITEGPITAKQYMLLGYFYNFSPIGLAMIREASAEQWPTWACPAIAQHRSWVFQCNPKLYRLTDALNELTRLTWRTPQNSKEIHIGDEVFLWQTGPNAAVMAVARVESDATLMSVLDDEQPYFADPSATSETIYRVWLNIDHVLKPPISRQRITETPELAGLAIFTGWQGTNFALTDEQADAVRGLIMDTGVIDNKFDAIRQSLLEGGLYFSDELLANYLLALQTKRFVLLTGISGTGKTQLALAVAKQFPQVVNIAAEPPNVEEMVRMPVQPYHLKYNSLVIPSHMVQSMRLPDLTPGKKSASINVSYPGGTKVLKVYYYEGPQSVVWTLSIAGEFREWFRNNLRLEDIFFLGVDVAHDDNGPDGLRFTLPGPAVRREIRATYAAIAVRPDWTDNRGLVGYMNPITQQYHITPFLKLLLESDSEYRKARDEERDPHPYFIILDEMNLARVEHYFSDFLSCMESGEPLYLHDTPELISGDEVDTLLVPRQLAVPPNLFFTGTVNVDETTSMFSPKVLDRAFTLEFNGVDLTRLGFSDDAIDEIQSPLYLENFPNLLRFEYSPSAADWCNLQMDVREVILNVHRILASENRHFGYRVANEMARFINLTVAQAGSGPETQSIALDLAVLQKVLPKFHGTQQELSRILDTLFAYAVTGDMLKESQYREWFLLGGCICPIEAHMNTDICLFLPRTASKVWRMLDRLHTQGFTSFME